VTAKVWSIDGRLFTVKRSAVLKHPELHLGVDKALFGDAEIVGILADSKALGDADCLVDITESGATDPGGPFAMTHFARGKWTGVWGSSAGFGGDAGDPIEAEDEWVITPSVSYQPLVVQNQPRGYVLQSVSYMVKCRPYGPTQAQIDAAVGIHAGRTLGARIAGSSGADLVLTGPNSKTITLKNAEPAGAGFEWGGSKLGNGEIGFYTSMSFTSGAANSLIEFSS
jgi:hypothetical protein